MSQFQPHVPGPVQLLHKLGITRCDHKTSAFAAIGLCDRFFDLYNLDSNRVKS